MSEAEDPEVQLLEGREAFAQHARQMVSEAYLEVAIQSQELEAMTYGTEAFADAISKFVLQHTRTRVRVLVAYGQQAVGNAARFVELGRKLTSFIEFRAISVERRQLIRDEYIIADGRVLLYREDPSDLESRYYGNSPPTARARLKDFDTLWDESTVAQELRNLGL